MKMPGGDVRMGRPVFYQKAGATRRPIEGSYVVIGPNHRDGIAHVGIRVANYDRSKPLVVDPTLVYSTFLGGTLAAGDGVAIDTGGAAYVNGFTVNCTGCNPFPSTTSIGVGGSFDVFVAKLNATGTSLVYSTAIGGSGFETPEAIAVDKGNNAFITGYTGSTNFPTNIGPCAGDANNAFVTKLTSTGALSYSTYLGGGNIDFGLGVAVNKAGSSIYLQGLTFSNNFPIFPNPGAALTTYEGVNGYVSRITLP